MFPGSKSNSFVIHCVAGTSRREDGWTDGWLKKEMVTENNAHGGECFAAPHEESACGANFAFSFWAQSLILTLAIPLEALGLLKGPSAISAL